MLIVDYKEVNIRVLEDVFTHSSTKYRLQERFLSQT